MYGWRARIGIIVSPPNTVAEAEFNRMAPEGVSIHASRMYRPPEASGLSRETLQKTNESIPWVAGALAPLKPDVLVYNHTLCSMVDGPGTDDQLVARVSEAAGCPVITTAGAILSAFQALGVQRVAMVGPYRSELMAMEKHYLEGSAPWLKVVKDADLGIGSGEGIGQLDPRDAFNGARMVDCPEAQAVFITGTNFRSIEVIELLEQDLGKPIISANQVGFWAALRKVGVGGVTGFGSLFNHR